MKYEPEILDDGIVSEPMPSGYCITECRNNVAKAITGQELLARLQPRIKSMFG